MTSPAAIIEKAQQIAVIETELGNMSQRMSELERERRACAMALSKLVHECAVPLTRKRCRSGPADESIPRRVVKFLSQRANLPMTTDDIRDGIGGAHVLSLRAALCRLVRSGNIERLPAGAYMVRSEQVSLT